MSDTPVAARWRQLILDHAQSNLSVAEFAHRHDLNAGTFKWWRLRLKKRDAKGGFTELVVAAPPVAVAVVATDVPDCTVVVAMEELRAHVVVDSQTDLRLLKRVLVALC